MTTDQRLDVLCSRGPWQGGKTHTHSAWTLTGDEVRAVYEACAAGMTQFATYVAICRVLGVDEASHRKFGRATQLLRKAGLIRHGRGQHWQAVTDAG